MNRADSGGEKSGPLLITLVKCPRESRREYIKKRASYLGEIRANSNHNNETDNQLWFDRKTRAIV